MRLLPDFFDSSLFFSRSVSRLPQRRTGISSEKCVPLPANVTSRTLDLELKRAPPDLASINNLQNGLPSPCNTENLL